MRYNINDVEYDYNSPTNQLIKRDFVEKYIHSCITDIVEYILDEEDDAAPFVMTIY